MEGAVDPSKKDWHGHVSAVTVDPDFRKQGLARSLMDLCEKITIDRHDAWYVDLSLIHI